MPTKNADIFDILEILVIFLRIGSTFYGTGSGSIGSNMRIGSYRFPYKEPEPELEPRTGTGKTLVMMYEDFYIK